VIRLLIADDQAMVREGFAALLNAQPDIEVAATVADGHAAVVKAHELRAAGSPVDVVLMDVRMPVLDGLAATRELLAEPVDDGERPTRVLVLTTFDLDDYVYEALRSGASGFLLKDAQAADLVSAVRVVAAGDALLAPSVTRRLIADFARLRPPDPRRSLPALDQLTVRETEVLQLIARGLSNAEIADTLVVAEQTVKTHVSRVLTKLDLRDRAQAVVLAYESGLVEAGR
jgi:DNA-binding NarL/FixJ family response regulator